MMSEHEKNRTRVHIDQKAYESPNPTTGEDFYDLAHVHGNHVLYREVSGNHEDELVRIDLPEMHLKEDEHFHTGKPPEWYHVVTINTTDFVVDHASMTFAEIVKLAFPQPPTGLDPKFTVSFEHAESKPHHGDLSESGAITIKKNGTIIDVAHSNRS
jgi:hypothetical protein